MSASVLFLFFFSSRRRHTRFKCDWSSDVCSSDLHDTNIWQITITPGKVKTISHDKFVGNLKTNVVGVHRYPASRNLVEQGGDFERLRLPRLQQLPDVSQRHACIKYIFHQDDIPAFERLIHVLDH